MLSVEQLSLDFKTFALDNIGFELPDRSTLVILGRRGAGKTLLLETIAGKYRHTGSISMNGIALHTMPPEKRNISLVYQNFGLFPFLTVFENTVLGEKLRGTPKQQYTAQAEALLDRFNIQKRVICPAEKNSGRRLPGRSYGNRSFYCLTNRFPHWII